MVSRNEWEKINLIQGVENNLISPKNLWPLGHKFWKFPKLNKLNVPLIWHVYVTTKTNKVKKVYNLPDNNLKSMTEHVKLEFQSLCSKNLTVDYI